MSKPLWVVIPNWDRFQHYADRNPVWIKTYVELTHDAAWQALTFHQRGVLLSLWLEYAASRRQVRGDTAALTRRLGQRVTTQTLDALSDAGFIRLSASKPLARRKRGASLEKEKEKEPPYPPQTRGDEGTERPKPRRRRERTRYTGCRITRGTHGTGYVRDVFGTDEPPADWPHPRPTAAEVEAALATIAQLNGEPDDEPQPEADAYPISDDLVRGMPE